MKINNFTNHLSLMANCTVSSVIATAAVGCNTLSGGGDDDDDCIVSCWLLASCTDDGMSPIIISWSAGAVAFDCIATTRRPDCSTDKSRSDMAANRLCNVRPKAEFGSVNTRTGTATTAGPSDDDEDDNSADSSSGSTEKSAAGRAIAMVTRHPASTANTSDHRNTSDCCRDVIVRSLSQLLLVRRRWQSTDGGGNCLIVVKTPKVKRV